MATTQPRSRSVPFALALHGSLLLLPMVVFTSILLGLVFRNLWLKRNEPLQGLQLTSDLYADILFVDYSATRLILVASWSSSAAIPLIGSMMTLSSFPIALDILCNSQRNFYRTLPHPTQLATLIDVLDGKRMALWIWLTDLLSHQSRSSKALWLVEFPVIVQLFGLVLSCAIIAADTWLHITTRSETMPFYSSVDVNQAGPNYWFSRTLTEDCLATSDVPCSITQSDTSTGFSVLKARTIAELQLNKSDSESQIYVSALYSYLGPRSEAFHDQLRGEQDVSIPRFTASTFATTGTCSYVDPNSCNLQQTFMDNLTEPNFNYSCPDGFKGTVTEPSWFTTGSWWNNGSDYFGLAEHYSNADSVEVGVFAYIQDLQMSYSPVSDSSYINVSSALTHGIAFLLRCNVSVGPVTYSWADDSLPILKDFKTDKQTVEIVTGPVLAGYFDNDFTKDQLDFFRDQLSITTSNVTTIDPSTVLRQFRYSISSLVLSLLGGTIQSSVGSELALLNSTVITVVPKAPLYIASILNLWFAGSGMGLLLLAIYVLNDKNTRDDVVEIQQLLTVSGLATALIDRHHWKHSNDIRIGVVKVDGKWQFKAWDNDTADEAGKALLINGTDYGKEDDQS